MLSRDQAARYFGFASHSSEDALGSVRQLADAAGTVILEKRYEPYGEVLNSSGSGATFYGFAANGYVPFLSAIIPMLVGLEATMTIVEVELPEKTAQELDALVEKGWFADRSEAIRLALIEFLGRNRLALGEARSYTRLLRTCLLRNSLCNTA